MSLDGSESLIFDTFSKFKQWKETLKTDRGLQFTFQWSRVQNGSQYWRYTCKHVRLTKTHPPKFAYMMVAIEVDGKVQVELNAPNINHDLFVEDSAPSQDAELSETTESSGAGVEYNETAQSGKSEATPEEATETTQPSETHADAAQSTELEEGSVRTEQSEGHDVGKDEKRTEGAEEILQDTAQLKDPEASQNELTTPEDSRALHVKMRAKTTIKEETESEWDAGTEEDAQVNTKSVRSAERPRLKGSKTNGAEHDVENKPIVKHARPWESTPVEAFGARFDDSIEVAVEADPDLFLGKNKTQLKENNSRKKFKNSGGTSDEIVQISTGTIGRVSKSDGSEQIGTTDSTMSTDLRDTITSTEMTTRS